MRAKNRSRTWPSARRAARFFVAALTLGLVTIAGAPLAASPAQDEPSGGIGLRLLDAPVSTKDDPRARVYIVDHLPPGTSIERRVEVANTTADEQAVVLYSAAASISDGTFLGAAGRTANDLASWTTVTPASTTVSAGGTETAVVTIAVPADAAPGERYGVVWTEVRSEAAEDGGVVQVSRVGIRLYVSVGPGGAPAADFEIESLTAERSGDDAPIVSATVTNTGGRALDMKGTLELTNGPGGLTAGPFPAELGSTLAIGDTESVHIALDERLPDGPWDAIVTLESGLIERTAEATISFPASGATAVRVTATENGAELPTAVFLAAGAVLVLLLAAGWLVRRRRRRGRRAGRHLASRPSRLRPSSVPSVSR